MLWRFIHLPHVMNNFEIAFCFTFCFKVYFADRYSFFLKFRFLFPTIFINSVFFFIQLFIRTPRSLSMWKTVYNSKRMFYNLNLMKNNDDELRWSRFFSSFFFSFNDAFCQMKSVVCMHVQIKLSSHRNLVKKNLC